MTSRRIGWYALAGLAALIAFAAPAAAEYYEGKPECPPEEFCTMTESGEPGQGAEEPTRGDGTEDCIDWCPRGDGTPIAYGPDDCIDCMGMPVDDGPSFGDCDADACAYDAPPGSEVDDCAGVVDPTVICDKETNGPAEPIHDQQAGAPRNVDALGAAFVAGAFGLAALALLVRRR